MARNVITEEEIIKDLRAYIASKKKNRYSFLSPLKREARTKLICDLVFSRPDVFKLATEIKFVPMDCLTDDILVKLVLADPENIYLLDNELITVPVMVAYEFSKRRFEYLSAIEFGTYALKFKYPQKIYDVRDSINSLCDQLTLKYTDGDICEDYILYVSKVSDHIVDFFKEKEIGELQKVSKVKAKYDSVDVNTDKKVLVLISGEPDSGKTTLGRMLNYQINNSVAFDSDDLMKKGFELKPLKNLVDPQRQVIIFSAPYANTYFPKKQLDEYHVVNIAIVPSSIEKMYRHSKYKQWISYDLYAKYEVKNPFCEGIYSDITVTNEYDERLWLEVDKVLEDMSILLDFPLPPADDPKKLER